MEKVQSLEVKISSLTSSFFELKNSFYTLFGSLDISEYFLSFIPISLFFKLVLLPIYIVTEIFWIFTICIHYLFVIFLHEKHTSKWSSSFFELEFPPCKDEQLVASFLHGVASKKVQKD